MSPLRLAHDTVRLEQLIAAPLATVWQAYADTAMRCRWAVPAGQQMVFDADDFRTGGRARYRCGTPGKLELSAEMHYHVVEPEEAVVYTETVRIGEQILATGLVSWELTLEDEGVCLTVTDQVTSFVGSDTFEDHRAGHTLALQQLATLLED